MLLIHLETHTIRFGCPLFSLGVVLYELLAGRRPFGGDSTADTMGAILRDDPPDLPQTTPPIPAALARIVRRCLEKHPAERFHSARDLAFTLEAIAGTSTSSGTVVATDTRVPRRWTQRAIWGAAGAAIGLVVGITRPRSSRGSSLRLRRRPFT